MAQQNEERKEERQIAHERHDAILAEMREERRDHKAELKVRDERQYEERREAQARQDVLISKMEKQHLEFQNRQDEQQERQDALVAKLFEKDNVLGKLTTLVKQQKEEITNLKHVGSQDQMLRKEKEVLKNNEIEDKGYESDESDINISPRGILSKKSTPEESEVSRTSTGIMRDEKKKFADIAEELYAKRSNDVQKNHIEVQEVFKKHDAVLAPLLVLCPSLGIIIAHMLVLRFGFTVKDIDFTSKMTEWGDEDCRRVGASISTIMRFVQTGQTAIDAWRLQYPQLNDLFTKNEGFSSFMLVIANNLLRDSKYGMIFRVSTGAILSIVDAASDIYVIQMYYSIGGHLIWHANALLSMILANTLCQLVVVLTQIRKKSWGQKLKEVLITLLFLRPAVDAFRVSTNHEDNETSFDALFETISNKVRTGEG